MSYNARSSSNYGNNRRGRSGFKGHSIHKSGRENQLKSGHKLDYQTKPKFLGTCDHFRQTEEGERQWQIMMQTKKLISEKEFLQKANVNDVLDEGETWEDYKETAKRENDPLQFYESSNGLVFFQTAGFEFIWKP